MVGWLGIYIVNHGAEHQHEGVRSMSKNIEAQIIETNALRIAGRAEGSKLHNLLHYIKHNRRLT